MGLVALTPEKIPPHGPSCLSLPMSIVRLHESILCPHSGPCGRKDCDWKLWDAAPAGDPVSLSATELGNKP